MDPANTQTREEGVRETHSHMFQCSSIGQSAPFEVVWQIRAPTRRELPQDVACAVFDIQAHKGKKKSFSGWI